MAVTSIYNSLNSKIKAMRGNLLKADNYYILSQQKTIEEMILKLSENKTYEGFMHEYETDNISLDAIEQNILTSLSSDFSRIYKFIYDFGLKGFFDGVFIRNEIIILKHILSAINDNRAVPYTASELETLINVNHKIDVLKLASSKTIPEFIKSLEGTVFYNPLSAGYDDESTIFDLEMKLDIYYYIHLWKIKNKYLKKANKTAMEQIYGTEIDLKNILWIYRLKTYYKLNENEIYACLIPINYRLGKRKIMRMVEAKSPEELWSEIKSTRYGAFFDYEQSIDKAYCKIMESVYLKSYIQNPNSLALTVGYIYAKEIETKNLTALFEGVRYNLKQEEILKYIIIPREKR